MLCSHWYQVHPIFHDTINCDRVLRMLNVSFSLNPFFERKIFLENPQPHLCPPLSSYLPALFSFVGQYTKGKLCLRPPNVAIISSR